MWSPAGRASLLAHFHQFDIRLCRDTGIVYRGSVRISVVTLGMEVPGAGQGLHLRTLW